MVRVMKATSSSSRRSSLAVARGLGSAGSGTEVWFTQRITWALTIILSIMVLLLMVNQVGNPLPDIKSELSGFWSSLLLIVFVAVTFYHYVLELTEVIEDYVHNRPLELLLLLMIRLGFAVVGLAAIVMILRNFLSP